MTLANKMNEGYSQENPEKKEKKKRISINSYALMVFIVMAVTVLTYIVPAGQYEKVELNGRVSIDPESFQFVKNTPVGIMEMFSGFHRGFVNGAPIILFVVLFGGLFGIMQKTGSIDALIKFTAKKFSTKKKMLIPVLVLMFSLLGTLIGASEDVLVYITIVVPLTIALGFDALTGFAIVYLGVIAAGFTSAITNPFTIGVAQSMAELPMYSGIGLRIGIYIAFYILTVIYIFWHVNKIEKKPELAEYGRFDPSANFGSLSDYVLGKRQAISIAVLLACFVALIFGVIKLGWYISEIAAIFFIGAIIMGIIGKLSIDSMTDAFVKGAQEMLPAALIIGFAQTILVVLNAGGILDTVLYAVSGLLDGFSPVLTSIGIASANFFIHFIVPSGSGHAALVMPIMAPLADIVGVTRQTTAFATIMGSTLSNIIIPTSGILLAGLGMMGISYTKWVKWVAPYVVLQFIIIVIFLVIAQNINYGPF